MNFAIFYIFSRGFNFVLCFTVFRAITLVLFVCDT